MEKRCHHCDTRKDVSAFYKNAATYDGLDTYCIECIKQIRKSPEYKNQKFVRKRWPNDMMRHLKINDKDY